MTKLEFFNRYQFSSKDKIGGGSFGTVFKAYDRVKSVYVAIKKAPVKEVEGKTFSLKDEIDALSSLSLHPNIAIYETVYSFEGEGDVFDYAVMQHYPGGNLKELLASKNLTEQQKISILEGIISGLEHLHNNGVVHRDIKPSNILIAEYNGEYTPKITDFGLSKIAESEHQSRFTSSFAGGTLSYASPEQLLGNPVKFNTDIWSIGVMAYEIFTGKLPFSANENLTQSAAKEQEIYNNIINANLPDDINSLPTQIGSLIRTCLQKDPNNRLSNVSDLNSHLQKNTDNDQTIIFGTSIEKELLAEPNSIPNPPKNKKESKGKIDDKSIEQNHHNTRKVLWLRAAFIVLSSIILLTWFINYSEDKKDWEKALNENTLSSYQEYKNNCGKCGFRTEASEKMKVLEQETNTEKIVKQQDLEDVKYKESSKKTTRRGKTYYVGQENVTVYGKTILKTVTISESSTTLHFISQDYLKGNWIAIKPESYIVGDCSMNKKILTSTNGIAIEPNKTYIEYDNQVQEFDLVFPPIDENCKTLDFVEQGGWAFNNIILDTELDKEQTNQVIKDEKLNAFDARYLGKHLFNAFFIDGYKSFGSAVMTKNGNNYSINGSQRNKDGEWVKIKGVIRPITLEEFVFTGTLSSYNPSFNKDKINNNDKCSWTGTAKFKPLFKDSKYWRMEKIYSCYPLIGDVDIFFN